MLEWCESAAGATSATLIAAQALAPIRTGNGVLPLTIRAVQTDLSGAFAAAAARSVSLEFLDALTRIDFAGIHVAVGIDRDRMNPMELTDLATGSADPDIPQQR